MLRVSKCSVKEELCSIKFKIMSKFTKYLTRAVDCAKPEKEAGFVSAVTKEGFLMARIVGDPRAAAQTILHAAVLDVAIENFVSYLCEESNNRSSHELPNESEDPKED